MRSNATLLPAIIRRPARWTAALAALAALAAAACQDAVSPTATPTSPLASAAAERGPGGAIAGRYIVVLKDGVGDVAAAANDKAARHGGRVTQRYTHAVRGFAAELSDEAAAALRADPDVRYVEPDRVVQAYGTQTPAPWSLDRLDQRDRPLSGGFAFTGTGTGVNVYIIDTGVRLSHTQFGGRAKSGFDATGSGNTDDCNGHGTHVAGAAAGTTYGVAKGASVWAVRVLGCDGSGTLSMTVAGVDWVTANHVKPAVANMSLGGAYASDALDEAVRRSIAAGVTYTVAAGTIGGIFGSPGSNACGVSPARVADAITVGATDENDVEWISSNHGPCVDLHAPGVYVLSASHAGDLATATRTGTSAAAPHAAGAAALYLEQNPAATPAQVAAALVDNATVGRVRLYEASAAGGTPNRLLYTGFIGGGSPGNAAPAADFTSSCSLLDCAFADASQDPDGGVVAWSWSFGDGGTAGTKQPAHRFPAAGSYTVTLTVTDDRGATSTATRVVKVVSATPVITLSAQTVKDRNRTFARLTWSGATSDALDVLRDGVRIMTAPNTGTYVDTALGGLKGTVTYRVCEAGTSVCSGAGSVRF